MIYTIIQIVHISASIMFLGFIFTDVVILPILKKTLGLKEYQKIKQIIVKRAVKVFPPTLIVIFLSGGYMFSKYINSNDNIFSSKLQILLLIKVFLATLIFLGVAYSLYCKFLKKPKFKFMNYFHNIVLILGFIIVVLAKLMLVV